MAGSIAENIVETFRHISEPEIDAVIDLDEGTRFVSNIVGCDPSEVRIGMRVEMEMETVDEAWSLPVFRPVS